MIASRTVFNTPGLACVMSRVAAAGLRLAGWRVSGVVPDVPRAVVIVAPHTSNWDFPLLLAVAFVYRRPIRWLGKDALFRGLRGPLFRWLGGIAVDRSQTNNLVDQVVDIFGENEHFILALTPEGTRSRAPRWRTGFYHIATGAGVPIVMGFADFRTRVAGVGPTLHPSGDLEADFAGIESFYRTIAGKRPELQGMIATDQGLGSK